MSRLWTRRDVMQTASTVGLGLAFGTGRESEAEVVAREMRLIEGPVSPFAMGEVELLAGVFKTAAETNERYLDSLVVKRLLHSFRLIAGITSSATPYGGWELPTSELRGHFAGGHYLSAVALAYAGTGNSVLRAKGDALVAGLAECQTVNGDGYLGAYPATFFDRLAQGQEVWAPLYTYHKILAGLIDMYAHTGNEQALGVAEGMADWVASYFGKFNEEKRQRMLRVEYGGMNESLIDLYALTHKEQYLAAAALFVQPSFLDPLAGRRDELKGLHANTNVPKVIGAARLYEMTGDRRHREIAEYFLGQVLAQRSYAIGNTSEDEHWRTAAGDLSGTLTLKNAECCVAYNLMKLNRHVYGWTGDPRWVDAYERTLYNARLGTQNGQGLKQYFFPMAAGYWRAYGSAEESFWCCTGSGAEDFAKFNDSIYFHRGPDVYVNLFIPSVLTWKEQGFTLRQETSFPQEGSTTLTVHVTRPQSRTVAVRVPGWSGAVRVTVNGRAVKAEAAAGAYLALKRTWRDGDRVTIALPMSLREEPLLGSPNTVAALYGPLVLAAAMGPGPVGGPLRIITGRGTEPKDAGPPAALPTVAPEWLEEARGRGSRFEVKAAGGTMEVMPMYEIAEQRYSVYWRKAGGSAVVDRG